MATTIITKNGSGAPLAGDLTAGELAVDLTNKRLYSKDSGGTVIELGTNAGSSTFADLTVSGDLTVDTDTLYVDSTNNRVGINDAAPDRAFVATSSQQVVGRIESTSTAGFLAFSDSGSANEINVRLGSAGDDFKIYTGGAEQVTIASSGNVGIGTGSSVDTKLHVENSSGIASVKIESGGSGTQSNLYFQDANTTVDGSIRIGSAGNDFRFFTSSTERMRIDASGNVGINYTNPDVPLCVGVDAGNTLAARFGTLSSAKAGDDVFVRLQARDSGSSNKYFDIRHLVDDAALTINGPTSSLPEILRIDADGIKFGGETTAAHALDDYEEGSWTPVAQNIANATGFTISNGVYTKVGRLVTVSAQVDFSTTSASAETRFTLNLPLNAASATHSAVGIFPFFVGSGADRFGMGSVYRGSSSDGLAYVYIPSREIQTTGATEGRITFTYYAAT